MAPRSEEEVSGVFSTEEDEDPSPPCLLTRHGWTPGMVAERDRLIRRAIEAEFERLASDPESSERFALSLYIVDEKQFLVSLGGHVRWRDVMNTVERIQSAANVPEELRVRSELGDVADHLGRVRHEWLTGRLRRRIDERHRLETQLRSADYTREELCACTDPRAHAGSLKEIRIFEELRYQVLSRPVAAKRVA